MGITDMFRPKETSHRIVDPTPEEKETARANRVEEKLDEYRAMDDAARNFYRTYTPHVEVEKAGPHTFVRLGDQEFVAEYCTDISVSELGRRPFVASHTGFQNFVTTVCAASLGCVTASLASGRQINFTCNRHAVDAVLAALQRAHKEALRDTA